jgi:glyoxylase-like metal-dependent hydrolase (beta-lactamase superfamily II)
MSEPAQLTTGVVRLGTDIVNWYLVADETGVTVVDAAVAGYRPQLEPGLALLGRELGDIRAVLLTHGDADHTGVAPAIRAETGAPIHIHPADEVLVRSPRPKKTDGSILRELRRPGLWRLFAHFARNGALRPPKIPETSALADGETVDVPGRPEVIHAPGHTPGHVAFLFAANRALFVGDMLCTWNPLTGDRGPQLMPRAFNTSTPQARESLARVEGLEADLVLPGHGDPWTEGPATAVARARAAVAN